MTICLVFAVGKYQQCDSAKCNDLLLSKYFFFLFRAIKFEMCKPNKSAINRFLFLKKIYTFHGHQDEKYILLGLILEIIVYSLLNNNKNAYRPTLYLLGCQENIAQ